MNTKKIKNDLNMLKMHIDQMDNLLSQTITMIYSIEEKLIDMEEKNIDLSFLETERYEKYIRNTSMKNFEIQEAVCKF
jgi:hypothetical protein